MLENGHFRFIVNLNSGALLRSEARKSTLVIHQARQFYSMEDTSSCFKKTIFCGEISKKLFEKEKILGNLDPLMFIVCRFLLSLSTGVDSANERVFNYGCEYSGLKSCLEIIAWHYLGK